MLSPGEGFAVTSPPWGSAGLGSHGGFRLPAPRGLCLEELSGRQQAAEGMEEAVRCGQPPWGDVAVSDGGENSGFFFFCICVPKKRAVWGWRLQSRQSHPLSSSNPPA